MCKASNTSFRHIGTASDQNKGYKYISLLLLTSCYQYRLSDQLEISESLKWNWQKCVSQKFVGQALGKVLLLSWAVQFVLMWVICCILQFLIKTFKIVWTISDFPFSLAPFKKSSGEGCEPKTSWRLVNGKCHKSKTTSSPKLILSF